MVVPSYCQTLPSLVAVEVVFAAALLEEPDPMIQFRGEILFMKDFRAGFGVHTRRTAGDEASCVFIIHYVRQCSSPEWRDHAKIEKNLVKCARQDCALVSYRGTLVTFAGDDS